MNKSEIIAAARKALIAADPNYYSWSEQQQELFRVTMNDAAQSRVQAVLLKSLLGIQCTAENAGEIWRDLPLSKLDNLNWAKLLTSGIGDDYIFLNESMAKNKRRALGQEKLPMGLGDFFFSDESPLHPDSDH